MSAMRLYRAAAQGTDHGWGGNAFVLGGAINGSRIYGTFPDTLRADSHQTIRGQQGRVIPTTGWEALWQAHAQWLGVAPGSMAEVLPNVVNFPAEQLLTMEQVFRPV